MAHEFGDFGSFAIHLIEREIGVMEEMHHACEMIGRRVEQTAKSEIGHYQPARGEFAAWELLADSTEDEKARLGYPVEAPLLRDGTLRDSITHEVGVLEVAIGSDSDIAVYQEFGTNKIPPRPFIGTAAFRNIEYIKEKCAQATVCGLIGDSLIHPSLGYNMLGATEPIEE